MISIEITAEVLLRITTRGPTCKTIASEEAKVSLLLLILLEDFHPLIVEDMKGNREAVF